MEPSAQQYRAGAFALLLVAAFTGGVIAAAWVNAIDGPLLWPLLVAYILFNFGFLYAVVKGRLQTNGARLGAAAVLLNLVAMLSSSFMLIWTALSVGAVGVALIAATMLFRDARTEAA